MKSNSTVFIITGIIVAGGVYWYFFTGSAEQVPLTEGVVQQNEAQTHFKALVSELTPITFNTGILSDPNFTALTDLATPITPEQSGRLDPFAAIPGVSGK